MILEHNGSRTWLRAKRAEGCEMAKMSAGDLKALLSAERCDALSAMAASKLSDERASALNYYMGNMSKDMPAPDGRSKAVSSDVADTIEGLMPPLMEIFAGGEEVVQFAPVGPEDVAAAEQETITSTMSSCSKTPASWCSIRSSKTRSFRRSAW
jgi:hypothetical protein